MSKPKDEQPAAMKVVHTERPQALPKFLHDGRVEVPVFKMIKNKHLMGLTPIGACTDRHGEKFEFGSINASSDVVNQPGGFYMFSKEDKEKRFLVPMETLINLFDTHINGPMEEGES